MIPFEANVTGIRVKPVKESGEVTGAEAVITLSMELDNDVLRALGQAMGQQLSFTMDTHQRSFEFDTEDGEPIDAVPDRPVAAGE